MEGQPSAVPQPLAAPASLRPMPSLDLTPEKETAPPFLKSHATFLNNKSKALQVYETIIIKLNICYFFQGIKRTSTYQ